MLKHPPITLQRVERCLNNEIRPRIYQDLTPLEAAVFQCPDIAMSPCPRGHRPR